TGLRVLFRDSRERKSSTGGRQANETESAAVSRGLAANAASATWWKSVPSRFVEPKLVFCESQFVANEVSQIACFIVPSSTLKELLAERDDALQTHNEFLRVHAGHVWRPERF